MNYQTKFVTRSIVNAVLILLLASPCYGQVLENGWSVVACRPNAGAGAATLAVKDITQFGMLWGTLTNRGSIIDHSGSMPAGMEWFPRDFGGHPVFSTTIDPRDGTIYTVTTSLYNIRTPNTGPATIYEINKDTGVPTVLATLPGNAGGSYLDIDIKHNQLFAIDMDSGIIHRIDLTIGLLLPGYDPFVMDDDMPGYPVLGERLLGVAYNAAENRVYYSVWADDAINNDTPNVVRSIGLTDTGAFLPATDDILEISLTTIMPVGDIEFNSNGTSVLLAETPFNSAVPVVSAHNATVTEWTRGTTGWSQVGTNAYYEIGAFFNRTNARGGVAWAYSTASTEGVVTGLDDFILVTADAIDTSLSIYGYQFTPRSNSEPRTVANSIVADLDYDVAGQDKTVYGDVDIYIYIICDVDDDHDVDKTDLAQISGARGKLAPVGDVRDADYDGEITMRDVKACIPQCTLNRCAIQ